MTRDDIIRMAREAGAFPELSETPDKDVAFLARFAELVAAAEREACAAIAKQWDVDHPTSNYGGCIANAILAKGTAEQAERVKRAEEAFATASDEMKGEQAERQEPVAWVGLEESDMPDGEDPVYDSPFFIKGMVWANNKLLEKNAAPPQRQPLTETEYLKALEPLQGEFVCSSATLRRIVRAVERKHGIGGEHG